MWAKPYTNVMNNQNFPPKMSERKMVNGRIGTGLDHLGYTTSYIDELLTCVQFQHTRPFAMLCGLDYVEKESQKRKPLSPRKTESMIIRSSMPRYAFSDGKGHRQENGAGYGKRQASKARRQKTLPNAGEK